MAYGNQDQGDRRSRSDRVFTLLERLSPRLASHGAEAMEAELRTRADHLIKAKHGAAQSRGVGFKAESWYALRDKDLQAAAREQLGIERGPIGVQPSASEGTVLGHIDAALGRHAIVDRGVNVIAVREIPGAELVLGQVLGAGIGR
ncbi:hypothetical protein PbB2_02679 [Candidatus Phycosocius bacilliformis]|uniref:Uncharacterized protein n=2 Tax=Candidatus Phycosocius bacilliformis TaxID=1445552 RepID=A0A2P2ED46_9PROT|nr:hypothetical protein PbB2_02679 [Candidatus Phycosocius bacilliformis]